MSSQTAESKPKPYLVYTVRLPLDMARAVRTAAERRYEPQSVLVRRLVERGLKAEGGSMIEPPSSPWLTAVEAARHARCGVKVVYREVKAGRLRAARIGGRRELRFRAKWVDAWLEATATPVKVQSQWGRAS